MQTAGVDLAAQDADTAACPIEWTKGRPEVLALDSPQSDDALLQLAGGPLAKVGIDAPFGWPEQFVDAITRHNRDFRWDHDDDPHAQRRELSFRETDRFVAAEGARPLSVSTDKIGITTMRCADLLSRLAEAGQSVARTGEGKVAEVYPSAALVRWGFAGKGYKRRAGLDNLKRLVADLTERVPWLRIGGDHRARCETDDDCFDALVCALVARAVAVGLTAPPPRDDPRPSREGWIHLPVPGSLERLVGQVTPR